MADIWCGAVTDCSYGSGGSRAARKRRMELRRMRVDPAVKHSRPNCSPNSPGYCGTEKEGDSQGSSSSEKERQSPPLLLTPIFNPQISSEGRNKDFLPKFGVASICGRRRGMEDAVSIHPSFCRREDAAAADLHYFGVFHGHGSSRVATKYKEKFHEIVKEELLLDGDGGETQNSSTWWKRVMNRSFTRLDSSSSVVAVVTPSKTVIASCGDSKAVLCRNGKAVPPSTDRQGELNRIQTSGGRVTYFEPEVTIEERSEEDEWLILASHGLWDVVSDDTACAVARMCLTEALLPDAESDETCSYASMQLTKLALARRSTGNVTVVVVDLRSFER